MTGHNASDVVKKERQFMENNASDKKPAFTAAHKSPSREAERSGSSRLTDHKTSSSSWARRPTGPRTTAGKQKTRYNAIKHGIFSQAVVLKGESRSKYESLLAALLEHHQPEGPLEQALVELIAIDIWRYPRLMVAEGAEIRRGVEFLEWDEAIQIQREVGEVEQSEEFEQKFSEIRPGLIQEIQNPVILTRSIELLEELRQGIESRGFDKDRDLTILLGLYGGLPEFRVRKTPLDDYQLWVYMFEMSEEDRERKSCPPRSRCKEFMLRSIDFEIVRLKDFQRDRTKVEATRTKLEILRRNIPDSPALDRLLRYQTHLDRSLGRKVALLEHLQRARRGQPLPPTLKS
jgi:hypothetical protein